MMNRIEEFFERLRLNRNNPEYAVEGVLNNSQFRRIFDFVLQDDIQQQIKNCDFEATRGLVFQYRDTDAIDRTIVITKNPYAQEIELIVLTNTKDENNEKTGETAPDTAEKVFKPAVRADTASPHMIARLRVALVNLRFKDPEVNLARVDKEISTAAKHAGNDNIGLLYRGPEFFKKTGVPAVYLFAELADMDLFSLLDQIVSNPESIAASSKLLMNYQILKGIINGLISIHEKGEVHGDIKDENVLLFFKNDGTVVPQIIDHAFTKRIGSIITPKNIEGSESFLSPQLVSLIKPSDPSIASVFNEILDEKTNTTEKAITDKDDIWALGMIAAVLLSEKPLTNLGSAPNQIDPEEIRQGALRDWGVFNDYPILAKMLAYEPEGRLSAAELSELLDVQFYIKDVTNKIFDRNKILEIIQNILSKEMPAVDGLTGLNIDVFKLYHEAMAKYQKESKQLGNTDIDNTTIQRWLQDADQRHAVFESRRSNAARLKN